MRSQRLKAALSLDSLHFAQQAELITQLHAHSGQFEQQTRRKTNETIYELASVVAVAIPAVTGPIRRMAGIVSKAGLCTRGPGSTEVVPL